MEFSPNYRKSNDTRRGSACCVVNCSSKKNINTNLSFHKVPKAGGSAITIKNLVGETIVVEKRSEWLKRLNVKDTNKQLLVCSLHFNIDDYVFPDVPTQRRYLKTNAVPVPVSVSVSRRKSNINRLKRLNSRRNMKKEQKVVIRSQNSKKKKNKHKLESDNIKNLVDCSVSTEILSGTAVNEMSNLLDLKIEKSDEIELNSRSHKRQKIN